MNPLTKTSDNSAAALKLTRPLVSIWTVCSVTENSTEDPILAAIESGKLRWAFNVARKNSKLREVRILSDSVLEFINGLPAPAISDAEEFAQITRKLFPHFVAAVRCSKLARDWNVGGKHILHLVDERELRIAKGSPRRKGRDGSPLIEVASAVELLKRRRMI